MSTIHCDCFVCDGYETYKDQPCTFCDGRGVHSISQGQLETVQESAKEYKSFIENGGKSQDWDG